MEEQRTKKRLGGIQALRAAAANAVVICHVIGLHARFYPELHAYDALAFWIGQIGVYIFFFVSGFVVIQAASTSKWQAFYLSRFTRIYPIYWVYLAASVMFAALWQNEPADILQILASASLVPANTPQILPVAWSLVFEVYFYAVVGVFMISSLSLRLCLICWAVAVIALMPISNFVGSPMALLFIAGGLTKLYPTRTVTRILGSRAPKMLIEIGDASYSLYLSHFLVVAAVSRAIFMVLPGQLVISLLASVLAANIVSLLSYQYLERPLITLVQSLIRRSEYRSVHVAKTCYQLPGSSHAQGTARDEGSDEHVEFPMIS